jgi:hypothetical protein
MIFSVNLSIPRISGITQSLEHPAATLVTSHRNLFPQQSSSVGDVECRQGQFAVLETLVTKLSPTFGEPQSPGYGVFRPIELSRRKLSE